MGSPTEAVIDDQYAEILEGVSVYTMACLSARSLGVNLWKLGCQFWGYYDPFGASIDGLEKFQQFANQGIRLYLEGKTLEECFDLTKQLGLRLVEQLERKGSISLLLYFKMM